MLTAVWVAVVAAAAAFVAGVGVAIYVMLKAARLMTETITASMDDVTASMAELRGRMTALTPAPLAGADGSRGALTWSAALVYGLARALRLRWAAQYRFIRHRQPGAQEAVAAPARPARAAGPRAAGPRVAGQRRGALNGRRGGVSP